jgi:hypothetical protein
VCIYTDLYDSQSQARYVSVCALGPTHARVNTHIHTC